MSQFNPTAEQKLILVHPIDAHARIFAGPGTGKSATLVSFIDQLLANGSSPRVKLLTFTRAATGELAKKVSAHPAAAAERPSTIHSFAISTLLRNPGVGEFPKPLRIADDWETREIVHHTLAKIVGVKKNRLNNLFLELASNWEHLDQKNNSRVDPKDRARFLGGWREHRDVLGYTLLSELPYALMCALQDHPDLDGVDYSLLIVDEYQDLNACDLRVLKLIADRGCSIIGAGDDDQSIYSFRNAAPEGIRNFQIDYPECNDYSLTVTHRCGSKIMSWATFVIEGDPNRPRGKPALTCSAGSPTGEAALLAFGNEALEAKGVARLVHNLIARESVEPHNILVLLRSDYLGMFSRPIKRELDTLGVQYSDPGVINEILGEPNNRRLLATLRLLVHRTDSLAWASLLKLENGIGDSFFNHIYNLASGSNRQFGEVLLESKEHGFGGAHAAVSRRATEMIDAVLDWLDEHLPPEKNKEAWGSWISANTGTDIVPQPSEQLKEILSSIDELADPEQGLARYLGQITPLAKDIAQTESTGVRIMTMAASKGLTVEATVLAGLEHKLVPRVGENLAEERRLLYVAMTRAKKYLFGTWARRRKGPTARAGQVWVAERRNKSLFLDGGPITSEDGEHYLKSRW